jgi:hypothetical protein
MLCKIFVRKLNTFAKCYKEFNLQKYLDFNIPKSLVKNITKLRISAHTFLIEKGRYRRSKLPRDLRQCKMYKDKEVKKCQGYFFCQCVK